MIKGLVIRLFLSEELSRDSANEHFTMGKIVACRMHADHTVFLPGEAL